MRAAKRARKADAERRRDATAARSLASAWNGEVGLRHADTVSLTDPPAEPWRHGNTWTHGGTLKAGWREVGRAHAHHVAGEAGIGETRSHGQALVCLAGALQTAQHARFNAWLGQLPPDAPLHICRHYDPTQLLLSFGRFQSHLQEHARYLVKDHTGKYMSVSWGQFKGTYPRCRPGRGLVEFMAQTLEVHTCTQDRMGMSCCFTPHSHAARARTQPFPPPAGLW